MMPDYNEKPVSPVNNLHHIEGLVSVSDRVARRKEEQRRRQQQKAKQQAQMEAPDELNEDEQTDDVDCQDGHIDFRA